MFIVKAYVTAIVTAIIIRRTISSTSRDEREGAFLFQRVSMLVQRYMSCYMTPCQPLTAQTDDLYPILYYLKF